MTEAKKIQIISKVRKLLENSDPKWLKTLNNKKKLLKELSHELYFSAAFTKSDLEKYVKPFLKENIEMIFSMKKDILKGKPIMEDMLILFIQSLGEIIRTERGKRRLSQKKLADKVGTTQQVVSRIESCKDLKQPTLETCFKFANALEVQLPFPKPRPKTV